MEGDDRRESEAAGGGSTWLADFGDALGLAAARLLERQPLVVALFLVWFALLSPTQAGSAATITALAVLSLSVVGRGSGTIDGTRLLFPGLLIALIGFHFVYFLDLEATLASEIVVRRDEDAAGSSWAFLVPLLVAEAARLSATRKHAAWWCVPGLAIALPLVVLRSMWVLDVTDQFAGTAGVIELASTVPGWALHADVAIVAGAVAGGSVFVAARSGRHALAWSHWVVLHLLEVLSYGPWGYELIGLALCHALGLALRIRESGTLRPPADVVGTLAVLFQRHGVRVPALATSVLLLCVGALAISWTASRLWVSQVGSDAVATTLVVLLWLTVVRAAHRSPVTLSWIGVAVTSLFLASDVPTVVGWRVFVVGEFSVFWFFANLATDQLVALFAFGCAVMFRDQVPGRVAVWIAALLAFGAVSPLPDDLVRALPSEELAARRMATLSAAIGWAAGRPESVAGHARAIAAGAATGFVAHAACVLAIPGYWAAAMDYDLPPATPHVIGWQDVLATVEQAAPLALALALVGPGLRFVRACGSLCVPPPWHPLVADFAPGEHGTGD